MNCYKNKMQLSKDKIKLSKKISKTKKIKINLIKSYLGTTKL